MTNLEPRPTTPDISVLVLAFNHEAYLTEALDGILGQDFKGTLEVLVGEDCSSDRTRSIADRYAERHPGVIRVISAPINVGMYANHERLVRSARAPVIAYCEGDDWWHDRSKLTDQLRLLSQHPEWVGVHSDFDHCVLRDGRWKVLRDYARRKRKVSLFPVAFEDLMVRNLIQTCTLILRRDAALAYMNSPFSSKHYGVDDWPLTLFATMDGKTIGFLARSTASYRRAEGSVTSSSARSQVSRIRQQYRLIRDFVTARPSAAEFASRGLVVTARAEAEAAVRELSTPIAQAAVAVWLRMAPAGPQALEARALELAVGSRRRHRVARGAANMLLGVLEGATYRTPPSPPAGVPRVERPVT